MILDSYNLTESGGQPATLAVVTKPWWRKLWIWSIIVTVLVIGSFMWRCSSGLNTAARQSDAAVEHFHQQFNAEQFDQIFAEADDAFRQSGSADQLSGFFRMVHRKMGPAFEAERAGILVNAATNGTFANVSYQTKFQNASGSETFTWRIDGNQLKLVGYHVNSPALFANE